MDKNKEDKKKEISKLIDLANGRFKDSEVDLLYDIVTNIDQYLGKTRTYKSSYTDWSSDGKYVREKEYTYTINCNNGKLSLDEHYEYHDDDGQSGSFDTRHITAREILKFLKKIID